MQEWESAEPSVKIASFSSLGKMLSRGNLDLNSVQGSTDSPREELKQAILNQELVFSKQVRELHRVYKMQVAMMEDYKQKALDSYILHGGGANSICVNMNNQGNFSLAGSKQSENINLRHEWGRPPGFMQGPLDLRLPADEFISRANEFPGKGINIGSLQHSIGSNNSSQGEVAFGLDNLRLSLGIGRDLNRRCEEHKVEVGKNTWMSSSNVIDLESPEPVLANNNASLGFVSGYSSPNLRSKGKQKLESLSQSETRHVFYGNQLHMSIANSGPSSQRWASFDSGDNGKYREFSFADYSGKNQKPTIRKGNNLDLNIAQFDEASHSSNNQSMVLNLSSTSISNAAKKVSPNSAISPFAPSTNRSKADASHCSEISETYQKIDIDLNLDYEEKDRGKSCKDATSREVDGHKISFIGLDSEPDEELCSSRSNPKAESVGSLSKLSNGHSCEMDTAVDTVEAEARTDKGKEPVAPLVSCHDRTATQSDCMIDQRSSSIKTMQSGVVSGDVNICTSGESNESKIQSIIENNPKVDETVQTAAELLVQLSSEVQGCEESVKLSSNELQNEEDNEPQSSCESYEALVLRAKEIGPDEMCVSSNAFSIDLSEKKENRYKLKRGTRMKDFQKDILPGLSVLSRHEIREDINVLEGVIRSREYRKMKAKMGGGEDWCRSSRSKRSRVNCGRRYNH